MNVWLILARFSAGNHPFGFRFCPRAQLSIRHTSPSKADLQITKRVAAAAQILQSISRITSSLVKVTSVSGKQDFCDYCTNVLRKYIRHCLLASATPAYKAVRPKQPKLRHTASGHVGSETLRVLRANSAWLAREYHLRRLCDRMQGARSQSTDRASGREKLASASNASVRTPEFESLASSRSTSACASSPAPSSPPCAAGGFQQFKSGRR